MQLMVIVVYGFAAVSALFWLYAMAVNVGLSVVRWTSDLPVQFSSVRIVGTLGGLMAYFSSLPLWQGWSGWWLGLLIAPDVIAVVSDAVYYRKHPLPPRAHSDNSKS
ncbi:MAG: hypothetical protein AAF086_04425 [Planctomycetota bacterium]